jgi:AraC-like DNA-binding protein
MSVFRRSEFCPARQDLRSLVAQKVFSFSSSLRGHPRVNRVLRSIPDRLARDNDVSLKTLADIAGLSPSRFMHVFTASVGMPLRPYILNLRLERACRELAAGGSVTFAACVAGFSDAAHLTRTFQRILGTTPSQLFPRKRAGSPPLSIREQEADSRHAGGESIFALSHKNEWMERDKL